MAIVGAISSRFRAAMVNLNQVDMKHPYSGDLEILVECAIWSEFSRFGYSHPVEMPWSHETRDSDRIPGRLTERYPEEKSGKAGFPEKKIWKVKEDLSKEVWGIKNSQEDRKLRWKTGRSVPESHKTTSKKLQKSFKQMFSQIREYIVKMQIERINKMSRIRIQFQIGRFPRWMAYWQSLLRNFFRLFSDFWHDGIETPDRLLRAVKKSPNRPQKAKCHNDKPESISGQH
jgi:hypothetical protein